MEQIAGRIRGSGPDRDRQQHHIHHGETRHRHPHQQVAPGAIVLGDGQGARVQLMRLIACAFQLLDELVGHDMLLGLDRGTLERQVHPRRGDTGHGGQGPLDRRDTGRTVDRRQGQRDVRLGVQRLLGQSLRAGCGNTGRTGRDRRAKDGGHGVDLSGQRLTWRMTRWENGVPSSACAVMRMFQLPAARSTGAT